ncbi:MAG: hypothetical protein ACOH1M_07555, partial [Rhodoglobus sp.]
PSAGQTCLHGSGGAMAIATQLRDPSAGQTCLHGSGGAMAIAVQRNTTVVFCCPEYTRYGNGASSAGVPRHARQLRFAAV